MLEAQILFYLSGVVVSARYVWVTFDWIYWLDPEDDLDRYLLDEGYESSWTDDGADIALWVIMSLTSWAGVLSNMISRAVSGYKVFGAPPRA